MSMNYRMSIGVDPGRDGAMAVIGLESVPLVVPFDEEQYQSLLLRVTLATRNGMDGKVLCAVEHVNAMPGQGVTSCFSFGQNFGFILGMLTAFRIPYELVRPQKWKKEFSCTSDKNTSIEVAKRLFPGVSLKRTERCTKDHDGLAEALLLATYAFRRLGGGEYVA